MKRVFTSILLVASMAGIANAQNISVDKVEENGTRYIVTSDSRIGSLGDLGLKSVTENGNTEYFVNLTLTNNTITEISKGRKLLLKLKNGEIIILENTVDICEKANKSIEGTQNSKFYYISPSYKVSENDLKKIANGEVVKVRIDKNYGNRDVEINNNAFSSKIKAYYDNIKEAQKVKKTFTSDF